MNDILVYCSSVENWTPNNRITMINKKSGCFVFIKTKNKWWKNWVNKLQVQFSNEMDERTWINIGKRFFISWIRIFQIINI
jgi:hypothetical protein